MNADPAPNASPATAPAPRAARPSPVARLFRWHRWLGWVVGLQVLAWVLGGVLFAWLPFQPWVKAKDWVSTPALALPADWLVRTTPALAALPAPVSALQVVATAAGPALRVSLADGQPARWLRVDGQPWRHPDAQAVQAFAQALYRGTGALRDVQLLAQVPTRLVLVQEAHARPNATLAGVWRVRFDDGLQTRLYIDPGSGELLAVRNEAWVWYDFFWRLHVMDWPEGENFNTPWLRAAALVALGLVASGAVLSARAAWRGAGRSRRRR